MKLCCFVIWLHANVEQSLAIFRLHADVGTIIATIRPYFSEDSWMAKHTRCACRDRGSRSCCADLDTQFLDR